MKASNSEAFFVERQTGLEPAQLRCVFDIYTPDP